MITLNSSPLVVVVLMALLAVSGVSGFQVSPLAVSTSKRAAATKIAMVSNAPEAPKKEGGYVPKWKKKNTLADEFGDLDFEAKGIKGSIPVKFIQGNETKTTMAMPGQPLRDVAVVAGQFIKYGCGKGECGTCEAMCNGKWVRPCMEVVPASIDGEELVIQVKEVTNKSTSSGTFFSVKSFFKGFWNNLLGMVGFVKYRRNAKKNWEERQEYEDLIRQKTLEKKQRRQQQQMQADSSSSGGGGGEANGKLSP